MVPLDKQGRLTDQPRIEVDLPQPDALKNYERRVVAIEPHPEKPLVYVWQDLVSKSEDDPTADAVQPHLYHLLVYELTKDHHLNLLQRTGRGEAYAFGHHHGSLVLDAANDRLYVPNTLGMVHDDYRVWQAAYVELDKDGRVVMEDGHAKLTGQQSNKYMFSSRRSWPFGYVPISKDCVIFGGERVPVTWDMSGKQAPLYWYALPGTHEVICLGAIPISR